MKTLRLHIFIALFISVACFIVGAFTDLQINQGFANINSTFGTTASIIGMLPGYFMFAVLGGLILGLAVRHEYRYRI